MEGTQRAYATRSCHCVVNGPSPFLLDGAEAEAKLPGPARRANGCGSIGEHRLDRLGGRAFGLGTLGRLPCYAGMAERTTATLLAGATPSRTKRGRGTHVDGRDARLMGSSPDLSVWVGALLLDLLCRRSQPSHRRCPSTEQVLPLGRQDVRLGPKDQAEGLRTVRITCLIHSHGVDPARLPIARDMLVNNRY